MKKVFLSAGLLFVFCFSGFGQVDSAAVLRQVDSLVQVSRTLTGKRDYAKALEVNAAAEQLALDKLGKESVAYGKTCFNRGRVLYFKENYPEAETWYFEAIAIQEKTLGREHPDFAQSLNNLGMVYHKMGNFEKAEPFYSEAKAIREKTLGTAHSSYAESVYNLGMLNRNKGNLEIALPYYLEAKEIREKAFGKEHGTYAESLNGLALVYSEMGNYEKAELLHLEAKAVREKLLGKTNPEYATSLNNLAILYRAMGNYENAEPLYLEAKAIREKVFGKDHPIYAQSLNNLANLYWKMGNYAKAEPLHLEAKAIREKVYGKESAEYAQSLTNLAVLYTDQGIYEKAEPLLVETLAIWASTLGKEHPDYAQCLNTLGMVYIYEKEHEKAEPLLLEARAIREKALGKTHPVFAHSLHNLAELYRINGDYEKAEPLFLENIDILRKSLGTEHPYYAKSLKNLGVLYWAVGNFGAAKPLILEARAIEKSLLVKGTHHLSERELLSYTNKFADAVDDSFSFALFEPTMADACYDNILFHKGFLLNAALQANNLVSSDPGAAENDVQLKSTHRRLAAEYAKPITERKGVAELESKANDLEKELAKTVAGFGEALRQVAWQEVQSSLKPDEAAIEFIRFHYSNPRPTDSTLYAALLLKRGMETPAFVTLFEERQLQSILAPLAGQGRDGLNELYGGQASQSLYRLLWSPLESHLHGLKTVYFSPAGLMHRFNLGAIAVAEGGILADRYELVCLGSTRQLTATDHESAAAAGSATTAMVFGGIRFDIDSTAYTFHQDAPDDEYTNPSRGFFFNQTDSTLRGGEWGYLKYSDKEADKVQSLLQAAGKQVIVHKGYDATEETFKALGNPANGGAPDILHLSTHGFFFPDAAAPSPPKEGSRAPLLGGAGGREPVFKMSDNPMMRSGLILAGGNRAWAGGQGSELPGNREDGILTAYEISQMDLSHTDLVVLSACETGLGHIEGNEGVYGLQRAFKIAGAKHIVMSLWQVPDYQTQELMVAFYTNMLTKEMPARQALSTAQAEMRQKRYEPFYWAGFVLVE